MDFLVDVTTKRVTWADSQAPVILGRGGHSAEKREGDGKTPIGRFALRRVFWRPDRVGRPLTGLPVTPVTPRDGWCDDPTHADYNRLISLPHPARHERLWRDDHVYDLILVIGHNDEPVIPGHGSAVFVHLTRPDRSATEGCVALDQPDLIRLLADAQPGDALVVVPPA